VIAAVERRIVAGLRFAGEWSGLVSLEVSTDIAQPTGWQPLDSLTVSSIAQTYFDLTTPLPPQRYYRAWQAGVPDSNSALKLHMIPALTLTGNVSDTIRVDGINAIGPTDAWFTLDTVRLTNTTQLYFDVTAPQQPARLYRLVPLQ
jgi:hypothetical protein